MSNPTSRKPWQQYVRLLRPEAPDLRTIFVYGAGFNRISPVLGRFPRDLLGGSIATARLAAQLP